MTSGEKLTLHHEKSCTGAEKAETKEAELPVLHMVLGQKNEGFLTAGQVQFVARTGNYRKAGLPYTGALRILKVALSYDYLWINIRVKGGAYGCMSGAA